MEYILSSQYVMAFNHKYIAFMTTDLLMALLHQYIINQWELLTFTDLILEYFPNTPYCINHPQPVHIIHYSFYDNIRDWFSHRGSPETRNRCRMTKYKIIGKWSENFNLQSQSHFKCVCHILNIRQYTYSCISVMHTINLVLALTPLLSFLLK